MALHKLLTSVPKSNFEENISTYVFGVFFWHFSGMITDCWTSRHLLCEKILNYFVCVEVRNFVEK